MTRLMLVWTLMPLVAVAQGTKAQETQPAPTAEAVRLEANRENFGAVVAPAALPDGTSAVSGWVGVPELGVAYRQGTGGWELGARARFDYLRLSVTGEGVVRRQLWTNGTWAVAPELGLGITGSTGSRYFDEQNLEGWFLRLNPALVATWRAAETVSVVGLVEVPYDLGLSPSGTWRVKPMAGGGAEVYLGEDLSLSAVGELGVDVFKELRGVTQTRLGYGVRLGLGVRLF
ncbi:hypothetical protein F0U60_20150 [Archangium minus]|uniref:Outer membrane protein beta-barrel domain-containing protein n=1 Tax=Archangium minus TaxID=83450 RepID=A0ABY9WQV6_9BACT|nr:hypothetical protein F0U60_20150 [Archangium minus]